MVYSSRGQVTEFVGELVATATREKSWDEQRSTVFQYSLYRTAEDGYVLLLDTYEKISGKSFCLNFKSEDDVRSYIDEDGGKDVMRQLFGMIQADDAGSR